MPVHRQAHRAGASVFAIKWELDRWLRERRQHGNVLRGPLVAHFTVEGQRRILIQVLERALARVVSECANEVVLEYDLAGGVEKLAGTENSVTGSDGERLDGSSVLPQTLLSQMQ
jgi:hypothetical protein